MPSVPPCVCVCKPMASPSRSGTSSGSTLLTSSGCEEDMQQQQHAVDLRRQKRKLSNRESARRSRMRKQKHLDDLTTQVAHLRKENHHILANLEAIAQRYLAVEGENAVLKARAVELGTRLQSLREILQYLDYDDDDGSGGGGCGGNGNGNGGGGSGGGCGVPGFLCESSPQPLAMEGFLVNPWNLVPVSHPIMASADMLQS